MQLFPRWYNRLPLFGALGFFVFLGGVVFVFWYYFSPKNLQVGYAPKQPVPYSHRLHAGQMGMDCRYCHTGVEVSAHANVPPTQTCMGCHSIVKKDSRVLEPVRQSWASGLPVQWVQVHKLPDHSYFNHSVHVGAGVGCVSCHGRIDQMDVVRLSQPISMSWCLDCHRNPEPNLRPRDQVTNMEWKHDPAIAKELAANVHPPENCSGCHR